MASDDESKDTKGGLKTREEFPGWNRQMRMLALALGDTDGVFTDMGTNANFGYQLYAVGAQGNAKRREWNELARKLVGKVANKIKNTALLRVWTDAFVDSAWLRLPVSLTNARTCSLAAWLLSRRIARGRASRAPSSPARRSFSR